MVSELHGWTRHFSWRPLSQDIRNYFGAKAPAAASKAGNSSNGNPTMPKKRPKPVVLSSSSESEGETKAPVVQVAKKKAKKGVVTKTAQVLSDSGTSWPSSFNF